MLHKIKVYGFIEREHQSQLNLKCWVWCNCLGTRGRQSELIHKTTQQHSKRNRRRTNQQPWRPTRRPGPQRVLLESLSRCSAGTWMKPSGGLESCTGPGTERSRTQVGRRDTRGVTNPNQHTEHRLSRSCLEREPTGVHSLSSLVSTCIEY